MQVGGGGCASVEPAYVSCGGQWRKAVREGVGGCLVGGIWVGVRAYAQGAWWVGGWRVVGGPRDAWCVVQGVARGMHGALAGEEATGLALQRPKRVGGFADACMHSALSCICTFVRACAVAFARDVACLCLCRCLCLARSLGKSIGLCVLVIVRMHERMQLATYK